MAPQQGPKVLNTRRLVTNGDEGQALVWHSGAAQKVPRAFCHQHKVKRQNDLGVRFAGLLALLEGTRLRGHAEEVIGTLAPSISSPRVQKCRRCTGSHLPLVSAAVLDPAVLYLVCLSSCTGP